MALWTDRERFGAVLFYLVVLLLGYLVFRVFQPFLVPLGWAGVLVVIFFPIHQKVERRLGNTRSALLLTFAVTLILIVPTIFLTASFVQEGIQSARSFQQGFEEGRYGWIQSAWVWVRQRVPDSFSLDLAAWARETAESVAGFLAAKAGSVLKNIALLVFDLVVVIFAMFYLFRDAGRIVEGIRRTLPFDAAHRDRILSQARDLIFASVTSGLIVAFAQGALGGIAFAIVGIGAPLFWGVMMGFFSLLPVVGAWVVWAPAAIWLMAAGEIWRGVLLLVLGVGVVGLVDNILRPALISGRSSLNGLLVFISLIGGLGVFGMLGIVLGPIVVATAAGVLEVYTNREETGSEPG